MNLDELIVPIKNINLDGCLTSWDWLLYVKPVSRILLVTKFAEIFFVTEDDEIWFLSTSTANYEKIASSFEEFSVLLYNHEIADYYFMPSVVFMLEEAGMMLCDGQCYGFRIPCAFEECKFEVSNFNVMSFSYYLRVLGEKFRRLFNGVETTQLTLISANDQLVCF